MGMGMGKGSGKIELVFGVGIDMSGFYEFMESIILLHLGPNVD